MQHVSSLSPLLPNLFANKSIIECIVTGSGCFSTNFRLVAQSMRVIPAINLIGWVWKLHCVARLVSWAVLPVGYVQKGSCRLWFLIQYGLTGPWSHLMAHLKASAASPIFSPHYQLKPVPFFFRILWLVDYTSYWIEHCIQVHWNSHRKQ